MATVGQVATSGSTLTRSGTRGLTTAVRERCAHPDLRLRCSIWCHWDGCRDLVRRPWDEAAISNIQ